MSIGRDLILTELKKLDISLGHCSNKDLMEQVRKLRAESVYVSDRDIQDAQDFLKVNTNKKSTLLVKSNVLFCYISIQENDFFDLGEKHASFNSKSIKNEEPPGW